MEMFILDTLTQVKLMVKGITLGRIQEKYMMDSGKEECVKVTECGKISKEIPISENG